MSFALTTDEGEAFLLNNALGGATLYVGLLHTADINTGPAEGDGLADITELSGSGYARQACLFGSGSTTGGTTKATGAQVTFSLTGTPTGGDATGFFLTDVASGTAGSLICAVNLAAARAFADGDTEKVTPSIEAQ